MENNLEKQKSKKGILKAAIFIILLLILAIFGKNLGIDIKGDGISKLQSLAKNNFMLASTIYVVGTIAGCVVLALPGVSFAIVAGVVFGPWVGTILCSVATTIGALGSFLAGRYFLKDAIEPAIRKNEHLEKLLLSNSDKNAMILLMITRLLPVFPYNLQNFAYGITNIKILPFTIYSFVFMLPGTAMFTLGAAGIAEGKNGIMYIGLAVLLAIVVFGSSFFLKKRMEKTEQEI